MANSSASSDRLTLGIVTVLYNCDSVLPGFFESLAAQRGAPKFRLYVIDNSTTDSGSHLARELSAKHGVDAIVIFNNANGGVAKGNNQGIELALADGCSLVLLANNDTEFSPDTIAGLVAALRRENVAAVTPKIYYHGTGGLLWYAGGLFREWTLRTPHKGNLEQDRGQHDIGGDTQYAPTCFMLVESSLFDRVGRMDEKYFCYYDDTDFVWRLRKAGNRLYYEPSCIVQHKVSTSTGGDLSPFSLYYMNRNRVYFARKNFRGVHRVFSLAYMTLTRVPRAMRLDKKLSKRLWAGVRDGWRLALPDSRSTGIGT